MLPDGLLKRKQYNELINRGVQILNEQEQLKADLTQLKAEVEEEIGKPYAKDYNKLVKARVNSGKVQKTAEDQLEMIAELEALANCANIMPEEPNE